MELGPDVYDELIDLLAPLMGTEDERRAWLIYALSGCPALEQINYSGPTRTFIIIMVSRLVNFGRFRGDPALWCLLKTIREHVGEDRQRRIDGLQAILNPPALPEAQVVLDDEQEFAYVQHRIAALKKIVLHKRIEITNLEVDLVIKDYDIQELLDREKDSLQRFEQELAALQQKEHELREKLGIE
ncbi:MAG: hypothetical protein JXB47_16210 [Anaerolineae bacterium]|nr:hypothetical protein [Anaerolineae bacterium]